MRPWAPLVGALLSPVSALLWPVAALLLLAGCAHRVAVDDGLNELERQARLETIDDWDMRGQLAIDTGEGRGRQARVVWRQRGDRLELDVSGFLGAGSFHVEGDERSLTVTDRDGTQVLDDPERQLSEMFGWWLPVTSLEYWLLGQPDADYPAMTRRGAAGTLVTLDQREWQIDYADYQLAAGLLVPRTMTLSHAPIELRLGIRDFEPVPPQP